MRAICSFSGGLDSILAIKLIKDQGIEVEAVHFNNGFGGCGENKKRENTIQYKAEKLGVKLTVIDVGEDLIRMIKDPRYGFGRNMNPCIDCHLFFFTRCGEYMRESGASFIITGEVVGERPMSQNKESIDLIERESGLEGLIVRPLSAKCLKPTIPEEKGWIDREKLLRINGRSRKPQIALAKEYGIDYYPDPAGGCQLTEPNFARRVRDIRDNDPDFDMDDVRLLNFGRHFRFSPEAKLAVGRNERENKNLGKYSRKEDIRFYPLGVNGPTAIGHGPFDDDMMEKAVRIIARYCDTEKDEQVRVRYRRVTEGVKGIIEAVPMDEKEIEACRI